MTMTPALVRGWVYETMFTSSKIIFFSPPNPQEYTPGTARMGAQNQLSVRALHQLID